MATRRLARRFNAFIDSHEVAWELTMAILAIVFVVTGLAAESAGGSIPAIAAVDLTLTLVFVAEFATRFAASPNRAAYVRGHWIDLVALVPAIREVRVLRLLRLLRLVRVFAGVYRAAVHVRAAAEHRGLALVVAVWLAVMVLTSLALYAAEHDLNKAVSSPLDALWWGVVTLTTVGYGDVYPITPEGRVAASILMLLGIGLFSVITASVTSYLMSMDAPTRPGHALRDLASLRDEGVLTQEEFDVKKAELLAKM